MKIKSLQTKLDAIRSGDRSQKNFIIADAKDVDMAGGIFAAGKNPDGSPVTMVQYRQRIRDVIEQGIVDIMLMSASNLEIIAKQEKLFENSTITPAARGNDTTDIWLARGSSYLKTPSRPFSTASIDSIQQAGANLALYSMTFNNNFESDYETLSAYKRFRQEAAAKGFTYFLEVFNPNVQGVSPMGLSDFVNDNIVRALAGVAGAERPQFLKVAYNGPKAMEQLCSYDPNIIVGILGGGSGTTMDAFSLLHDAQKYGAMVALFGRKINNSESPLDFIYCLRLIADGEIKPLEAVKLYHDRLKTAGIKPIRPIMRDTQVSSNLLKNYGG